MLLARLEILCLSGYTIDRQSHFTSSIQFLTVPLHRGAVLNQHMMRALPIYQTLELFSLNANLHNLIDARVIRAIEVIFLQNRLGQKPAPEEMSSPIMFNTWLGRRQTNQRLWHELRPRPLLRRAALYVPGRWRVNTQHGDGAGLDLGDDGGEGVAEGAAEGEAEDGIDEEIRGVEGLSKGGCEWDEKVVELGFETLDELVSLGHCWLGKGTRD